MTVAPAASEPPGRKVADPDLHLRTGGRRIDPVMRGGLAVFHLDLPCPDLVLVSRAGRPRVLGINADDRLLGYRLLRLVLDQGGQRRVLPLDHPGLGEGLHAIEPGGARWTDGSAALPADLFGAAAGPAVLEVVGTPLPAYPVRDPAQAALFARFAALGDDCEFGLVQREFDAEPADLLRWAGTDAARLVLGLCRRFDGLGDPAHTALEWREDTGEYFLRDPRYLSSHTWQGSRLADAADEEAMRIAGCSRLRLLRRKLLADIAAGRRILVYKTHRFGLPPDHMVAIREAVRAIGPAPLLFVVTAERPEQVGTVEPLGDRSWRGHIDVFGRAAISFAAWHRICAAAASLVDAEPTT